MANKRDSRARIEHLLVEVNCVCKRPDSFEDMVACDCCNEWWHYSCAYKVFQKTVTDFVTIVMTHEVI